MRAGRHRAFLRWNGGELLHVGFRRRGWTSGLSGLSWRCGARGNALRLCALGLGGLHGLGLARRNGRLVRLCRRHRCGYGRGGRWGCDSSRRNWRRGRRRWSAWALCHRGGLRRGLGCDLQHGRQILLQLVGSGGGEELAAGALRHAGKRLECLFRLCVKPDHMDAQPRRGLLQRLHRGADIGLAAVEAVGDEHDVEARGRRLLGGLDQRRGDRPTKFWLEASPEQKLARSLRREFARLGDELSLGAGLALAVTGRHEAEGNAVLVGLEGVAESSPHDGDLALAADLRPHAARAVEHDDGRWGRCLRRKSLLALCAYAGRTEESDGREQTPKPEPALPSHGVHSRRSPEPLYPVRLTAHASENRPRLRPIWGSCAPRRIY